MKILKYRNSIRAHSGMCIDRILSHFGPTGGTTPPRHTPDEALGIIRFFNDKALQSYRMKEP